MIGDQEILKTLHSEEDIKYKIVVPYLIGKGYKEKDIFFNVPITAYLGRQKKVVYADLVVKEGENTLIIVETKNNGVQLSDIHKEQAISYARQFDPRAVPIAVVTNGSSIRVYDVRTKKSLSDIPSKDEIISILADIHITNEEKIEAGRFIIEGYKDVNDIKNALDKCHDIIRANDGLDPISSFDEINKLIYTRIQEEKRSKKTGENRFTSKYFIDNEELGKDTINTINDIFQDACGMLGIENRIFDTDEKINLGKESIISIVGILENKSLSLTSTDIIGLAYESFLPSIFRGERLGQFFTPDRLKEFIVDILNPKVGDIIIDPAFGSGGFLVLIYKTLLNDIESSNLDKNKKEEEKIKLSSEYLYGTEINPRLALASKTNMYLHGDGRTRLYKHDGLINVKDIEENKFSIVVTNPPFGSLIDKKDILEKFDLGRGRKNQASEILFLERCVRLAKEGGKIGIVIPESVLINTTGKYIRNWLNDNVTINAIFRMPSFAFNPSGAGVSTSVLIMTKEKPPANFDYNIFMANVEKIGYDCNNRPDKDDFPNIQYNYQQFLLKGKNKFDGDNSYVINRKDGELLSVNFYSPRYTRLIDKIKENKYIYLTDVATKDKNSIVDGPFGTQLHTEDYKNEGIPVIRVKNIGRAEFLDNDLIYISEDKHKQILRSRVQENDILISKTGATFGKACLFPKDKFKEGNMTASCCKISVNIDEYDPEYICEMINSDIVYKQLERFSVKSAQPGFNLQELKQIIIPYKTKEEQKNIIDKIRAKRLEISKMKEDINNKYKDIEYIRESLF